MTTFQLERDINLVCLKATSFPAGIRAAFAKLGTIIKHPAKEYFGISYFENGEIVYKAAVEQRDQGEAESLGLETFIFEKGTYFTETVNDFMNDPSKVKDCFERMLALPEFDERFPCIEWYTSPNDVRCIVRKKIS